ncbi:MAG TPA: YfhO family protein, partial [Myxococcales bacterium]|nr:YfhO family protein [Myxococcales bacterium]
AFLGGWAGIWRFLAFAAASGVVAVLIGAPYWLPLVEDIRTSWSVHPPGLGLQSSNPTAALQWIVPAIFSARKTLAFLDRPAPAWTFLGGLAGTIAVLGIVAPIVLPKARRFLPWLAAAVIITLKVFGFGPLQWMGRLPLLEQMSFSYFWFSIVYLFAICGLGAVSELMDAPPGRRALVAAAAAVLVIEALLLEPFFVKSGIPGGLSPAYWRQVAIYSHLAIFAAFLAWAMATARRPLLRNLCLVALGTGVFVELAVYRYPLSVRGNPTAVAPFATWLLQQQQKDAPFRVMGTSSWLMPNMASAFGLDDVRVCDALVPKEYMAFIQRYFERDLLYGWLLLAAPERGFRLPEGMLNLLNIRYLVTHPILIPDYVRRNRAVYSDAEMQGGALVENLHAWPRIFAVQNPDLVASSEAALERLGQLDASAPFAVVADDFPRLRWSELCKGCAGGSFHQQVSGIRYGTNTLSFQVEVSGPAVLVVSDSLAKGWRAWVDDAEQPIFRANYLFRGLVLEAGAHRIRYSYEPPGWRASLRLFFAGIALLAVGAGALYFQRARDPRRRARRLAARS